MKPTFFLFALALTSIPVMAEKGSHSHNFSKEAVAFHDVMSPLWHADSGPQRVAATCAKVNTMKDLARQVKKADNLVSSVIALTSVCENDLSKFEETFHALHEAFHRVIEAEENKPTT